MRTVPRYAALCAAILTLLGACGDKTGGAAPGGAPPPPTVGVVTVSSGALTLTTDLPGRLEASRTAQVRARTAGIVLQRAFAEGGEVKAGALLFRIDPASYQATYASTQASVAKAEANLAQANLKAKRFKPLFDASAVSAQEYDDAVTAQKQAGAELASAQAARQSAAINLAYTSVTAPIGGRIGRALVTEGALVGQGEATPLATISQLDPIYVTMTQSAGELLRLRRALASGQLKTAGAGQAKVSLVTEDGQLYPQTGKLLFSDITVDESSGAISMRAEFPNHERTLLPGMYVRARLEQAVKEAAITVPQQAVVRNPEGASVLVVGADNKVVPRTVVADTAQGDSWIISSGLVGGERVIVEGLQKAKPGSVVKPVPWQPGAAAGAFASAAVPASTAAQASASAPAPAPASAPAPAPASAPAAAAKSTH